MKGFDTLSIIRFIKSIILSASFELQNCVKTCFYTSACMLTNKFVMFLARLILREKIFVQLLL